MDHESHDEVSMPALLRAARTVYGTAIRKALGEAGYDNIPRNGIFVLGAIARSGAQLSRIIRDLGVSKQSGGQLVDTLVSRGYLDREVDAQDRRRLTVSLSERGRGAAQVTRAAVARVDAALAKRVGRERVGHLRATLLALLEIRHG